MVADRGPAAALGAVAAEKLIRPGVVLAGTIRRDRRARISGVEPLIMEDELWLSMLPDSAKARDLGRDARIVLNSIITGPAPDAEVKVRGTARLETNGQLPHRYAAAVSAELGWRPMAGQFTLFAIDIDDVTYIGSDRGTGAQHVARWPPPSEYLRARLTPTSLARPQDIRRLLS
jgi:hypothetical protein